MKATRSNFNGPLSAKDTIELFNRQIELFRKFRQFRQFSELFRGILAKSRQILSFSEVCREIPIKIHQNLTEKCQILSQKKPNIEEN